MSLSPGQYSNTNLAGAPRRRKESDPKKVPSFDSGPRHGPRSQPGFEDAERRTLLGALELVADRRPGVVVPEVLYNDLGADVSTVLRRFLLALLSSNNIDGALAVSTAIVRLMTMQPGRRWLDARLVLRITLMAHEAAADDLPLISSVRDLVAVQGRWQAAVKRHALPVDTGNPGDWELVRELTSLPLDFAAPLRSLIARSIIRQDVLGARQHLTAYARQHRESAIASRRLLDQHAPTLSSLFGAELTPTRPMSRPVAVRESTAWRKTTWAWAAVAVLVMCGTAVLLVARPSVAREEHMAVTEICQIVGHDHPACLTASTVSMGLEYADCAIATDALPVLEDQLANFGLNREFAVIRADGLGELRGPYDDLALTYAMRCQ